MEEGDSYLVAVRQLRVQVHAAVVAVEGVADVAEEGVLEVEPADVLGARVAARQQAEDERQVVVPGEGLVAAGQLVGRRGTLRRHGEDDPLVGGGHVVHHAAVGRLEPALLQLAAVAVEEEVGHVGRAVAAGLVAHGGHLARGRVHLGVGRVRRRRVAAAEVEVAQRLQRVRVDGVRPRVLLERQQLAGPRHHVRVGRRVHTVAHARVVRVAVAVAPEHGLARRPLDAELLRAHVAALEVGVAVADAHRVDAPVAVDEHVVVVQRRPHGVRHHAVVRAVHGPRDLPPHRAVVHLRLEPARRLRPREEARLRVPRLARPLQVALHLLERLHPAEPGLGREERERSEYVRVCLPVCARRPGS